MPRAHADPALALATNEEVIRLHMLRVHPPVRGQCPAGMTRDEWAQRSYRAEAARLRAKYAPRARRLARDHFLTRRATRAARPSRIIGTRARAHRRTRRTSRGAPSAGTSDGESPDPRFRLLHLYSYAHRPTAAVSTEARGIVCRRGA